MEEDIRWEQRFSNYKKALQKFNIAIDVINANAAGREDGDENKLAIDDMLKEGLVQRFEYTHELAWNVMKDYAEFHGSSQLKWSRDATREAFRAGLISDGEVWMDMIDSRNKASHTYNQETANEIYKKIVSKYQPAFNEFYGVMEKLRTGGQPGLFEKQ